MSRLIQAADDSLIVHRKVFSHEIDMNRISVSGRKANLHTVALKSRV